MAIYLDYDQAGLDRQYDQRIWAPDSESHIANYRVASDAARAQLGAPLTCAYGSSPAELLDVFRAAPGAPLQVFLHGGAWRSLSKEDSAFAAPCFVAAGAHFVALDFAVTPNVTLAEMVAQARRAIVWLHHNAAATFGGDAARIYISGHSSGAHMAACLLTTDWAAAGLPADIIKGGVCASGSYDLEPVRLSARNTYLKLDVAMAEQLSPIRHLSYLNCPLVVAHGSAESDEFKRHARAFAAAAAETPNPVQFFVGESFNHFDFAGTLAEPDGLLGRAALRQMHLA